MDKNNTEVLKMRDCAREVEQFAKSKGLAIAGFVTDGNGVIASMFNCDIDCALFVQASPATMEFDFTKGDEAVQKGVGVIVGLGRTAQAMMSWEEKLMKLISKDMTVTTTIKDL